MIHNTGWYFCTESNWDNEWFDVRNLLQIRYKSEDWNNLIDMKSLNPHELYSRSYNELKPEVFAWLEQNVKDQKNGLKGWCCGNKEYNSRGSLDFNLFFYRRKDTLNFIKTWSVNKKPTETFNQDTYVRKILDVTTNKLIKV